MNVFAAQPSEVKALLLGRRLGRKRKRFGDGDQHMKRCATLQLERYREWIVCFEIFRGWALHVRTKQAGQGLSHRVLRVEASRGRRLRGERKGRGGTGRCRRKTNNKQILDRRESSALGVKVSFDEVMFPRFIRSSYIWNGFKNLLPLAPSSAILNRACWRNIHRHAR